MSALKDDIEMLSDILQKGLTANKGIITDVDIPKDTAFLNIECLLNDRYWGFFCYQTVEENIEENGMLTAKLLMANKGSMCDEVPYEEMSALEEVLSNVLTDNKATIVDTNITNEFYVSVKFEFGDRDYSAEDPFTLHSYVSRKKQLQ